MTLDCKFYDIRLQIQEDFDDRNREDMRDEITDDEDCDDVIDDLTLMLKGNTTADQEDYDEQALADEDDANRSDLRQAESLDQPDDPTDYDQSYQEDHEDEPYHLAALFHTE